MKAIIKSAKLRRIDDVWKKHKPQGLGFSDTDVIIIELKIKEGKEFTQNFYFRLKGDGTVGHSITKASEKRQLNILTFIKRYISKEKNYNIRANIIKWKDKEVEVEKLDAGYTIKI
ncbi:hypothetical protein HYX19_00320 [Candidatus Woesearchaeota archaeon]|nr:hypothetical protein [Candidatus Woesearchaeota archaeon]